MSPMCCGDDRGSENAVLPHEDSDLGDQCTWPNDAQVAIAAGTNLFWQVDLQAT